MMGNAGRSIAGLGTRVGAATIAYGAAIAAAEGAVAVGRPDIGVAVHGLVFVALLHHHLRTTRDRVIDADRQARGSDVLVALMLIPLLRMSSLAMPLPDMSVFTTYTLVGIPVFVATVLAARMLRTVDLRSQLLRSSDQLAVVVAGIPLGLAAYAIARPEPLHGRPIDIVLGSAGLVIFSAATEELLFRGVLQATLYARFGRIGVVGSVALFTSVYLGARPLGYVLFAAVLGSLYSWYAASTRSLLGVVVSHAIVSVSAIVTWPLVLG
jgi:CAAX protease family protein